QLGTHRHRVPQLALLQCNPPIPAGLESPGLLPGSVLGIERKCDMAKSGRSADSREPVGGRSRHDAWSPPLISGAVSESDGSCNAVRGPSEPGRSPSGKDGESGVAGQASGNVQRFQPVQCEFNPSRELPIRSELAAPDVDTPGSAHQVRCAIRLLTGRLAA